MPDQPQATNATADQVGQLLSECGYPPTGPVELIGSGQWSDCFAFRAAGRDLVIRLGEHVEDFRKDQVAQQFARPGLPIPEVLAVGTHGGGYYAISTRVFGDPIEKIIDWPSVVVPLADLLEALRTTDPGPIQGWGRWTSDGRAEAATWREFLLQVDQDPPDNRVHGWRERLASYPAAAAAFADGYAHLEPMIIDDVPRSLVHNDLFNRNAHMQNGAVTGVFDWGNSLIGDHLYDLALLCFWSPWFAHIDEKLLLTELHRGWEHTVDNFSQRLRVCMLHTGLEHIGYHAFLYNETETMAVADRLQVVMNRPWKLSG